MYIYIYSIQEKKNLHVVYHIEFLSDNYERRNTTGSLSPTGVSNISELDPNLILFRV